MPEPSDHSTMMRVPGRSSVEKNISFFVSGKGSLGEAFLEDGIEINIVPYQYMKTRFGVKGTWVF